MRRRAELLRIDLAAIDLQLKRLDKAIRAHDPVAASREVDSLNKWESGEDLSCAEDNTPPTCAARRAKLKTYVDQAISARGALCLAADGCLKMQPARPESSLERGFHWLGLLYRSLIIEFCSIPSAPSKLPGYLLRLLKVLGYFVALMVAGWLALDGLFRLVHPKRSSAFDLWYVWSIEDKTGAGAAGAIMEALDIRVNPLIAPFVQEEKAERKVARSRRQLLLAPPFHDEHFHGNDGPVHALRNLVWKDYLDSGPEPLLFVEQIPFDLEEKTKRGQYLPRFELAENYEEVDASVGGLQLKGIMGLLRNFNRWKRRRCPGVVGVVNSSTADGRTTWTVRLNCDNGTKTGRFPLFPRRRTRIFRNRSLVASVFADSAATEFGDTLGTVAQRAALKLVTRIADHERQMAGKKLNLRPYDSDQIHAIALFRQGIDTLMQCL